MSSETGRVRAEGEENGQAGREGKRAQFAEGAEARGGSGNLPVKILAIVAVALVGVAVYLVAGRGGAATAGASTFEAAGGDVSIPVSDLSAKARFYEYKTAAGKTVRFFAMRSPDGVYRAALDACDVCFAAKQGYSQEGSDMVCNKCGMHFPSAKINESRGGCNPVGLERKVNGDRLTISARELEAGVSYF